MDVPILGQPDPAKKANEGPQIRLLFCMTCKVIEELPDFEGRPEDDHLLKIITDKHTSTDIPHEGRLMKVPVMMWAQPEIRAEISQQIFSQMAPGLDAIVPGYYNTRNQFAEDAMKCYNAHLRPKGGCPDYGTEAKVLRPDTKDERADLGLPTLREGGPKTYLCQFCPVHTYMVTKRRQQAGAYK